MTLPGRARRPVLKTEPGFTLVELMIAVALVGVLAGLSVTNYMRYVEKARIASAVAEIVSMSAQIDGYIVDENDVVPDALAEAGVETRDDPWGHPYQYLRIAGMSYVDVADDDPAVSAPPGGGGGGGSSGGGGGSSGSGGGSSGSGGQGGGPPTHPRQDQFLRPVNSDYDLYSMGPDGETQFNLSSGKGRDDIVRALDGAYVGIAGQF